MIGERNPIAIALAPGEPDIRFRQSILNILAIALSQMGRMDPLEDFIEMNPAAPPGMAVELLASDARGNRLFTASRAAGICLWDLRSGQCLRRRSVGRTACTSLAVSPDGRFVAAGLRNRILILDAADLREVRELCGHTGTVQAIHFSPNDPVLASGAWDSTIRIWDLETGEERHCLKGHVGPVGCVQFARGGRVLASAGNDAALRFWDVPTGLLLRTVLDLSPADYLVLSSDGRYRGTPAAVSVLSFTIRGPGECRNVTAAEYAVEVGETLNVEALRLR
jgi:WD40 repeat protein